MDRAERLADYLAGELDADERAAFEAELARDAGLRAQLDAVRAADAALETVEPTALPEGFEERLRAAVDAELDRQLGTDHQPAAAGATWPAAGATAASGQTAGGTASGGDPTVDELAARRAARQPPRWVAAVAGAAAAIALVAAGIVGLGQLGGLDSGDDAASLAEGADEMETMDLEMADPESVDGPTLVVDQRDLAPEEADAVLDRHELQAVAEQGLDESTGAEVGERWREELVALAEATAQQRSEDAAASTEEAPAEAETDADDGGGEAVRGEATDEAVPDVSADDRTAVESCLAEVLEGADGIPAYVELGRFEGDPAVFVGLVTYDPTTDAFTRRELWVLDRADCQVLRFAQR